MDKNNDCASVDLYESLNFCQGQTVLPGIRMEVFFQKKSNILGWPTLPGIASAEPT